MDREVSARNLSRRTVLRSLGIAGTGVAGTSLGVVSPVAAEHPLDDAEVPVAVERGSRSLLVNTIGSNIYSVNNSMLAYYGAYWDDGTDSNRGDAPPAWRHQFMLTGTGWTYKIDDDTDEIEMLSAISGQQLSVTQAGTGDPDIIRPERESMIGAANPVDFEAAVRDEDVDLRQLFGHIHEHRNDPVPIDFDQSVEEWDNALTLHKNEANWKHGGDVVAFMLGLHPYGAPFAAAWVGYRIWDASRMDNVSTDLGEGFHWPSDDNWDGAEDGFGATHFAKFDVAVEPGEAGSVHVSNRFSGATDATYDTDEPDIGWTVRLGALPEPDEEDLECVPGGNIWRKAYSVEDTDGYNRYYERTHEASPPQTRFENPQEGAVYEVDEPIQFDIDPSMLDHNWHAERRTTLDTCDDVPIGDVTNGGTENVNRAGTWDLLLHERNRAGLSGFDERTIHRVDDLDTAVVPVGSPGNVAVNDLELPTGTTDDYREVQS